MASIKVAFLNVGHGDSNVIIFPDGTSAAVIDTPDAKITLDYLLNNHIDQLKWIVISHSHADHIDGMIDLIDQLHHNDKTTETIYYNRDTIKLIQEQNRKSRFRTLLSDLIYLIDEGIIKNRGIPAITSSSFMPINGVEIKILHPSHDDITRAMVHSNKVNDASVVIRLCYGQNSILFTGDLSENGWKWLKSRNQNISSVILKFPHHGSWFEGVPEVIQAINPEYVILSYGKVSETRYGLPSKRTLNYLNMKNLKIFTTKFSHQEFLISYDLIQILNPGI